LIPDAKITTAALNKITHLIKSQTFIVYTFIILDNLFFFAQKLTPPPFFNLKYLFYCPFFFRPLDSAAPGRPQYSPHPTYATAGTSTEIALNFYHVYKLILC
jgi:hypothetical protein